MTAQETFTADHQTIRAQLTRLQGALNGPAPTLTDALAELQKTIQRHIQREEVYYRVLDDGKRVQERELMHSMRNDHAAVTFSLESLAIRLRKNGYNSDWQKRLENLLGVLLPHMDHEEKVLFPKGTSLLTPAEMKAIEEQIQRLE